MLKNISIVVAVIVVGGLGYLAFQRDRTGSPASITENQTASVVSSTQTEETPPAQAGPAVTADVTTSVNVDLKPVVITFTDSGYSPKSVTVKKGTTVTWKNESSLKTWPASAKHPTHEVYPTTGGCLGSTFDACKGLAKGETWVFRFDAPGTWNYHDHLKSSFFGTVVVE